MPPPFPHYVHYATKIQGIMLIVCVFTCVGGGSLDLIGGMQALDFLILPICIFFVNLLGGGIPLYPLDLRHCSQIHYIVI